MNLEECRQFVVEHNYLNQIQRLRFLKWQQQSQDFDQIVEMPDGRYLYKNESVPFQWNGLYFHINKWNGIYNQFTIDHVIALYFGNSDEPSVKELQLEILDWIKLNLFDNTIFRRWSNWEDEVARFVIYKKKLLPLLPTDLQLIIKDWTGGKTPTEYEYMEKKFNPIILQK